MSACTSSSGVQLRPIGTDMRISLLLSSIFAFGVGFGVVEAASLGTDQAMFYHAVFPAVLAGGDILADLLLTWSRCSAGRAAWGAASPSKRSNE